MLNRLKGVLADFFQQADLMLLGLCSVATVFGIVLIFSATQYKNDPRYVIVQTAALLLGICAYIGFSMVNLDILMKKWKWILAFNVGFILLLLTPLGRSVGGNRAWLKFPGIPISIGPAEVVKITFVLLLAWQLAWLREERRDLRSFRSAAFTAAHAFGLCGLYFIVSSDMGNGLVFLFIFMCMAFVAGYAIRWFVLLLGGGTAAVAVAWQLDLILPHMRNRFLVLFDHSYQPLDAGWQQTRSLLTLGSGGLFGQGYLNGTQTQSSYSGSLPARWTDFIFSAAGEELGMFGCIAIMALLAAIILRVLLVAKNAQTLFHCYVCVGMAAMLIFQTVINIGMCLFVMPVIGITLPFFSYGGSSIVTLYMAMGVVSGIKKRSPTMRRPGHPLR
ncbi:FtsW/RodA/SpoVE family cell cycle protein [uncultured Oscillibacter sp.]|uniref:FtsW/RodA/SpoVE family cell cycle protein n=1 Tax=uncultured Oscillibacter sp. TaxID=876091 RepID=UPI0025D5ED48|nr:FtsW/RodA/SpoVE family cell cycle protein [uncultured Oscillibacter sp.]